MTDNRHTRFAITENGGGGATEDQYYKAIEAGTALPKARINLTGNGDFRSEECTNLLKQSDIVVTNPPFSLFKPYFNQLIEYKKEFLILANMNAIGLKDIWPHIQQGKVWLGTDRKVGRVFRVPDHIELRIPPGWVENGIQYTNVFPIVWFTNLEHTKRHNEEIFLTKRWSHDSKSYVKYDNYDAIEVSKVRDIPEGYDGKMGVPISFMLKHNPGQFDLLGVDYDMPKTKEVDGKVDRFYLGGKRLYFRLLIQHRKESKS